MCFTILESSSCCSEPSAPLLIKRFSVFLIVTNFVTSNISKYNIKDQIIIKYEQTIYKLFLRDIPMHYTWMRNADGGRAESQVEDLPSEKKCHFCVVYDCANQFNWEKVKRYYWVIHKGEKCRKLKEQHCKKLVLNLRLLSGGVEFANVCVCSDHFARGMLAS